MLGVTCMLLCGSSCVCFSRSGPRVPPAPGLPCALLAMRAARSSKARAKCAARPSTHVCSPLAVIARLRRERQVLFGERSVASHSVIASAATCPPKPLAKAEAIQNLSAAGFWIASSQELLATTRRRVRALLFALVPRTQRSVLPAMRSTVRFDDALQSRGPSICAPYHVALGAGSAPQRHKRVYARLRCAMALQLGRDTRDQGPRLIPSPPFSTSQCLLMSVSCLSLGKDRNDCHAGRDAATIDWRQAMALKAAATAGLNEGPVTWLR
ncbi:hypothetical protein ABH994_004196 [Bradyrhizobium yuanmingense]